MNLRRDVVILACAISAGIHGALAPAHFAEGAGAGVGFVASTILLAALAVDLTVRPASSLPVAGAAIVFAGLLGSYALATTVGLPLLHPQPEPVDGLALATKAFEVVGLATAMNLLWRRPAVSLQLIQPKGTRHEQHAGRAPDSPRTDDVGGVLRRPDRPRRLERPRRPCARQRARTRRGDDDALAGSALRSDMRVLWEDHIVWTRLAIISLTTGSPDTQATVGRLLKNQADIGNAVKPFYGKAAGNDADGGAPQAHPDRGRRDRRRQGRRPGQARRRPGPLAAERGRHRRRPQQRQPALLEARRR